MVGGPPKYWKLQTWGKGRLLHPPPPPPPNLAYLLIPLQQYGIMYYAGHMSLLTSEAAGVVILVS